MDGLARSTANLGLTDLSAEIDQEIAYPLPGSEACCDACDTNISRFYHCTECGTGDDCFDLCELCYSSGEKLKEQEVVELGGESKECAKSGSSHCHVSDSMERSRVQNPNLRCIHRELSLKYAAGELDGFGRYMWVTVGPCVCVRLSSSPLRFAIVLRDSGIVRQKNGPDAIGVLCESVLSFPWNWSAWVDLSLLCTSTETALPPSFEFGPNVDWIEKLFTAHAFLEMGVEHFCEAALQVLRCSTRGRVMVDSRHRSSSTWSTTSPTAATSSVR